MAVEVQIYALKKFSPQSCWSQVSLIIPGNHGQQAMDEEAEFKDHESSAGAARTGGSRLEGGKKQLTKESKGREICGGGLIRQKKGLVSLRLSLGPPGLGTPFLSKEWPCSSSC